MYPLNELRGITAHSRSPVFLKNLRCPDLTFRPHCSGCWADTMITHSTDVLARAVYFLLDNVNFSDNHFDLVSGRPAKR